MACVISAALQQTYSRSAGAPGVRGEGKRSILCFGEAEPNPSEALPQSWLCLWGKNFINNDEKSKSRQTSALGSRREHGQQVFEGKLPWYAS